MYVSGHRENPYGVEWIRFEEDALYPELVKTVPHVAFEINNMPPGDYTIEVWHETYGTQEQQIKIDPNSSQNIEFSYSG